MQKLPEVQQAKELMNEAMEWSTFRWLLEKSKVREIADRANDALDRLDRTVKARWSVGAKATYKKLSAKMGAGTRRKQIDQQAPESTDPETELLLEKVAQADDAAERARMDAEETFDQAERQMSTGLAREGCRKAIHSWELHEKAIRRAEAVANSNRSGK